MKIAIRHELTLPAPEFPGRSVQHLLLTPFGGLTQKVLEWSIEADGITRAASFIDGFGNRAHVVNQARRDGPLRFVAEGIVETHDHHGVIGRMTGEPMPQLYLRTTPLTKLEGDPPAGPGADRIAYLHALMADVGAHFAEAAEEATGASSQSQSQDGAGQQQAQGESEAEAVAPAAEPDRAEASAKHAHLFIAKARAVGIPARFVTGYVAGEDAEPSGFQCWAEAYDTGLGWIGFDPLLGYCPTEWHVRLATGLDLTGTVPLRAVPANPPAGPDQVRVDIILSAGQ